MKKILLIAIIVLSVSGCKETAKGEKIGNIVKCAYEGFFIKTYECELIRGNLTNGSGSFGKSFHFTVEDKDMIKKVDSYFDSQKEVVIEYHKEWITLWRTENDNYFLDDIKQFK